MVQVFTDQNIALVGSVRGFLENNGIACQLRNEYSSSVMGEVSFFLVWPELWVADAQAQEARELIKQLDSSSPSGPDWTCRNCGESNPGTFDICWQCGTAVKRSDSDA